MMARRDPFSPEERTAFVAALEALMGTQGDEYVTLGDADGTVGTFQVAQIDDDYCVYVEWSQADGLRSVGLDLPGGSVVDDEQNGNATITLPGLDAGGTSDVLAHWARSLIGDKALVWKSTINAG
jgi:hypothetical protein